jgi:beta-lactamase superfamily II metal-dependent hydrolase
MVLLTHSESDHYGGLIEIFKRYNVEIFIPSIAVNSNNSYRVLENEVGGMAVRVIDPSSISTVRLGMIYLDIVYPFRDVKMENYGNNAENNAENELNNNKKEGFNKYSTVAILRLNNFRALFTGDLPSEELKILSVVKDLPNVDYIKIAHHGSKSSLSPEIYDETRPEMAIISVGKGNSYGLPDEEVLKELKKRNIKVYRTDKMGDVVIETDGNGYKVVRD